MNHDLCVGSEPRTNSCGVYVPVWAFDIAFRFMERFIKGEITVYQDIAVEIARARVLGRNEIIESEEFTRKEIRRKTLQEAAEIAITEGARVNQHGIAATLRLLA